MQVSFSSKLKKKRLGQMGQDDQLQEQRLSFQGSHIMGREDDRYCLRAQATFFQREVVPFAIMQGDRHHHYLVPHCKHCSMGEHSSGSESCRTASSFSSSSCRSVGVLLGLEVALNWGL